MKCIVKSTLAMMIVAAIASQAWAQDQVVLSTSNFNPLEGTTIGRTIGQAAFTKAMYVWVTANTGDEIAPQTVGYTDETINSVVNHVPNSSAGLDLSYTVSAQSLIAGWAGAATNVFLLNGASVYNPTLVGPTPTTSRWDMVTPAISLGTPAATISEVNAVAASVALDGANPPNVTSSVTAFRGLENVNAGSNSALSNGSGGNGIDPMSATRNSQKYFLLGEVDLSVTAYGTAQLAISAGSLGLYQGSTSKNSAYTLDSQTVKVALLGDADLNGQDNQLDNNAVTGHWQQVNQTWATGDFDYNGQVNQLDSNALTGNWQKSIVGSSTFSGVPEPCSLLLMGFGSVAFLAGCRKIRTRKDA